MSQKINSRLPILGIPLDRISLKEALEITAKQIKKNQQVQFSTPNPEIILKSLEDREYKHILNNCAVNFADGAGLFWASTFLDRIKKNTSFIKRLILGVALLCQMPFSSKKFHQILPQRVTGSDFFEAFFKYFSEKQVKVFLLGAAPGIGEQVATKMKKLHNYQKISTFSGSPKPSDQKQIVDKINDSAAEVLFVAFGAPAQEKWIAQNLHLLPNIKVAIGVGGAFDFSANKRKRPSKILQKLGLEWLGRIIQEPSRIKRILNAVIVFPWTVIKTGKK